MVSWLFEEGSFSPTAKLIGDKSFDIVTDHLGAPVGMYDSRGMLVWNQELDIWGKVKTGSSTVVTESCPFRFPGQYEDDETGLYYNRFRYFDPEIGGYISVDPIGLAGGNPTLFGYVGDSMQEYDPLGLVATYYPLDSLGRPTGAFAELTSTDLRPTGSSTPTFDPPGWVGGAHPHHQQRSHLIADTLGGSGSHKGNIVALTDGANHPGMSSLEGTIRRHVRAGNTVLLEVIPTYEGNQLTPKSVKMFAVDQHGRIIVDKEIQDGKRQKTKCC